VIFSAATSTAQNVLTRQNDIGRTGRQLNESILNTTNVTTNNNSFGKVFTYPVIGQIYAQPLAVMHEFITACNQIPPPTHCNIIFPADVIYVATEDDWLYAFDATGNNSNPFWSVNLAAATTVSGGTFVSCQMQIYSGCNSGSALYPDIGVTGTPVIDTSSNTIYVVSAVSDANRTAVTDWLHAIDLGNGSEKFGGPIQISASYAGPTNPPTSKCQTGSGAGGTVNFVASKQLQRPGLLLLNVNGTNIVYIGFSMYDGATHSNGWVLGYAVNGSQQLAQVTGAVFNTAPFGTGGGIWESGEGLAAETRGGNTYIYVPTADGTFDANVSGNVDYGNSLLKLTVNSTTSIGALSIASGPTAYFTPSDANGTNGRCLNDKDFGSGGVMLLPSDVSVGTHLNLMINAEKLGYLWVTDRDNLSGYNPTGDLMVQKANTKLTRIGNGQQGYWSSPAYHEWGTNPTTKEVFFTMTFLDTSVAPGPLNQYNLDSTHPIPVDPNTGNGLPNYSTATLFCTPVPTPSISAKSDNTNGILWAVENSNANNPALGNCSGAATGAVLHAYDATKVNNLELYNSGTKLGTNTPTKFLPPTVFKGRVYIGTYQASPPYTNGELDVFGICTSGPTGSCL
jgi:hypothetical protein